MRWSEDGFNHLLHLRLAWVNLRFDVLFSDEPLTLGNYLEKYSQRGTSWLNS